MTSRLAVAALLLLASALPGRAGLEVEWESQFGGPAEEWVSSAVPLSGRGYLVAGSSVVQPGTPLHGGSLSFYLARTDAAGAPVWQREIQPAMMGLGANAVEAEDGGFVMVGTAHFRWNYFDSDIALVKTDADGNLLWTRFFSENRPGTIDSTYGVHVQRTADGGFILLGSHEAYPGDGSSIVLIRTDADGNELWRSRPGDPLSSGSRVLETADGGFAVCGGISRGEDSPDLDDMYLLKTDARGAGVWSGVYGTDRYDACGSFRQTADGGYVLLGGTLAWGVEDSTDYALAKTDEAGRLVWLQVWGSPGDDWSGGVAEIEGGGFVVTGSRREPTANDPGAQVRLEAVRLSAAGNVLSGILLGEPSWTGLPYAEGFDIEKTEDGGFIVGGRTSAYHEGSTLTGGADAYLVKLGPLAGSEPIRVAVDIKPGNAANRINRKSEGSIPVAILSAPGFDAAKVDPATVRLAGAPVASNKHGRPVAALRDVNGDGRRDLVVHVLTAQLQIAAGDTRALLTGETRSGDPFVGSDRIFVLK